MTKVTGIVERLEERDARGGGRYVLVHLGGVEDGFFDWEGHLEGADIRIGDEVAFEYGDGQYPRLKSVEKLAAGAAENGERQAQLGELSAREIRITRQCCVKAAARVVQGADLEPGERVEQIVQLAQAMESWVLR